MRRNKEGRRRRLLYLIFLSFFFLSSLPVSANPLPRNLTLENLEKLESKLSLLLQERIFAHRRGRSSVQPLTLDEFRLAQFLIRNHRELLALLTLALADGHEQAAAAFGQEEDFSRLEKLFVETYDLSEALEQVSSLPELMQLLERRRGKLLALSDAVQLATHTKDYGVPREEALLHLLNTPFDPARLESQLAQRLQKSCEHKEPPAAPYPLTYTIEFDDQVIVVHGSPKTMARLKAMLAEVSPPYVSPDHLLEVLSRWEEASVERFFRPQTEPIPLTQKTIRAAVYAGDLPPLASLTEAEARRLMRCLGFTLEWAGGPPTRRTLPFCFVRWSGISPSDSVWLTPCPWRGK